MCPVDSDEFNSDNLTTRHIPMGEPPISKDFSGYIRRRARDQHLSISQLAENSGVSRQALYKLMEGDAEAKLSTIIRLSGPLEVHPLDILRAFFGSESLPFQSSATVKYPLDASSFIEDVTVPDNMRVWINQRFLKTCKIQNTGKMAWRNRRLVYMDQQLNFRITTREKSEISLPAPSRRLIHAEESKHLTRSSPVLTPGNTHKHAIETNSYTCRLVTKSLNKIFIP